VPDLPRSRRHLGQRYAYRYFEPTSRPMTMWLSVDDPVPVEQSLDVQTIESQQWGSTGAAHIADVTDPDSVLTALLIAREQAYIELGQSLRDASRVIDVGEEPEYTYQVIARAIVRTWPNVPGITGPDWELLEESIALPYPLARMVEMVRFHEVRDFRQVVWAVHPGYPVPSILAEYFTFVRDERVPPRCARLARMV
jgi:hypothetical protein